MNKKLIALPFVLLISLSAFAVTDAEVRQIIRNTYITGEGARSEGHGYENYRPSRPVHGPEMNGNVPRNEVYQILNSRPGVVWAVDFSNINYAYGEGTETVTVYLAYQKMWINKPYLTFAYFETHRSAAAQFYKRFKADRKTPAQAKAGEELIAEKYKHYFGSGY